MKQDDFYTVSGSTYTVDLNTCSFSTVHISGLYGYFEHLLFFIRIYGMLRTVYFEPFSFSAVQQPDLYG